MDGAKMRAALVASAIGVMWPHGAMAADDVEPTQTEVDAARADKPTEQPPDWLFGVGVSFPALAAVGAGVGGLAGPLYSAGVERRLSDSLWLTGMFGGSYQSSETDEAWGGDSTSYALDGQLGLRHVVNPDDRFQLSVLTSLGGFYARSTDASYQARTWGVHVDAGLALDFWVADAVTLRVANRLLSLGHSRTADGAMESDAWFAEVGLSPSFAVGLGF